MTATQLCIIMIGIFSASSFSKSTNSFLGGAWTLVLIISFIKGL